MLMPAEAIGAKIVAMIAPMATTAVPIPNRISTRRIIRSSACVICTVSVRYSLACALWYSGGFQLSRRPTATVIAILLPMTTSIENARAVNPTTSATVSLRACASSTLVSIGAHHGMKLRACSQTHSVTAAGGAIAIVDSTAIHLDLASRTRGRNMLDNQSTPAQDIKKATAIVGSVAAETNGFVKSCGTQRASAASMDEPSRCQLETFLAD